MTSSALAVFEVARLGLYELLCRELDASGVDINTTNSDSATLLHVVAVHGHVDLASELLRRGIAVDRVDKQHTSALHEAIMCRHVDVVRVLLDGGASSVQRLETGAGRLPLHLAVLVGSVDIARLLLDRGAGVDTLDWESRTPLSLCSEGRFEIANLLVRRGAALDVAPVVVSWASTARDERWAVLLFACGCVPNRLPPDRRMTSNVALQLAAGAERRELYSRVTDAQINAARRKIARARIGLIAQRAADVCLALQSLRLPALVSLAIVDEACLLADYVSFRLKWEIVTKIKHAVMAQNISA